MRIRRVSLASVLGSLATARRPSQAALEPLFCATTPARGAPPRTVRVRHLLSGSFRLVLRPGEVGQPAPDVSSELRVQTLSADPDPSVVWRSGTSPHPADGGIACVLLQEQFH